MSENDTVIIVPARLASTRFPRKLLHMVQGKPILLWTADRLREQVPHLPLFFAVAEEELVEVLSRQGYQAILTDPGLPSGTDRIAQANQQIGAKLVINVQADEPLVSGRQINTLIEVMQSGADLGTLATPFNDRQDFLNPNKVKVVCDSKGNALYFSRAPIPFDRDANRWGAFPALWHLGLYAYTASFLAAFASMQPGVLEQIERLEQLRALENGFRIAVGLTPSANVGIDTPEDVDAFIERLKPEVL